MFDFFRKYNKFVMFFLFLLIIPSFVLFGVDRYTELNRSGESVATVDGQAITRPEWDAQHRNEVDRLRQQMPSVDPALLDSEAARYATLERMVRDRVLVAAASKANLTVSDMAVRLAAEDRGVKNFRNAKGELDEGAFRLGVGMTPDQFAQSVRAELTTQQVLSGVTGTGLASQALADVALNAIYDQREVQVARFSPKDFAAKVNVSDADLESYYKAHTAEFQAPEQASIEYIVLDLDAAKKSVAVNDADLKAYYEQNKERFGTKEERRASHILITAAKDAPAAEREKAKAKAEQLLAEVRKSPGSFGELARKNSQDPGSAEKGGELDFVTRGAMVKPFEDAVFAMKKGEISNVVESEFGYHVIRLDDIKPAVVPPFEQVRAQIENDVRTQQATQDFAKAAESMTDLVYQQADSLQPAADKLKLTIQKASGVTRTPAPGAKGALASRNFLSALFAPESLERKHNTEAIEIGSSQLASGRVTQYSPARALPFAEVKDKVRELLVAERAAALAKTEGEAKLAAWQANPGGAALGKPVVLSRAQAQSEPAALIEAALRVDASKLPAWVGVSLGNDGYAVVRVNKDVPRPATASGVAQQERAQLAQAVGAAEAAAYYEVLKARLKVKIVVPRPPESVGGGARS
ncbi:peptidylprolyl isomerase [Xenophilus aerolatus]|nr:peptidylprolyl isomerase [Xenophilus aerolatus]